MRILKGYSKEIQNEMKDLKSSVLPASALMNEKSMYFNDFSNLRHHTEEISSEEEIEFLQDITDYLAGRVKFNTQKYYLKLVSDDRITDSFLNRNTTDNILFIDDKDNSEEDYQTQFTMDEIEDLGDKYVPFAIPVSEVNE